jgi:hypothetical protein
MFLGMIVTRLWIAHAVLKEANEVGPPGGSWRAKTAVDWKRRSFLKFRAQSQCTRRWKGALWWARYSSEFCGIFAKMRTRDRSGGGLTSSGWQTCAQASCWYEEPFPPVDLRAVCLVRAIAASYYRELKNDSEKNDLNFWQNHENIACRQNRWQAGSCTRKKQTEAAVKSNESRKKQRPRGNWWLHRPSNNNQHQQTALLNRCIATGKANSDRHRRTVDESKRRSKLVSTHSFKYASRRNATRSLRSWDPTQRQNDHPQQTEEFSTTYVVSIHYWNRDIAVRWICSLPLFGEYESLQLNTVGTMDSMPWCQFGLPWWTKSVVLRCNLRCQFYEMFPG